MVFSTCGSREKPPEESQSSQSGPTTAPRRRSARPTLDTGASRSEAASQQSADSGSDGERLARLIKEREQAQQDSPREVTLVERDSSGNVTALWLGGLELTDSNLLLLTRLPELRQVKLRCTYISADALAPLSTLPHLEELVLSGMWKRITPEYLEPFTRVPTLRLLKLDESVLTDDALAVLRQFSGLKTLMLQYDQLTDESVQKLGKLQVEELGVGRNEGITDRSLEWFAQMPKLKRLLAWNCSITPAAAREFEARTSISVNLVEPPVQIRLKKKKTITDLKTLEHEEELRRYDIMGPAVDLSKEKGAAVNQAQSGPPPNANNK